MIAAVLRDSSRAGLTACPEPVPGTSGAGPAGIQASIQASIQAELPVTIQTENHAESHAESRAALAHDANNLLTALQVYCDLLDGPDAVAPRYRECLRELRGVAERGARLITRLAAPLTQAGDETVNTVPVAAEGLRPGKRENLSRDWRWYRNDSLNRNLSQTPSQTLDQTLDQTRYRRLDRMGGDRPQAVSPFSSPLASSLRDLPDRDCRLLDLAAAVEAERGVLQMLAGPGVSLEVECNVAGLHGFAGGTAIGEGTAESQKEGNGIATWEREAFPCAGLIRGVALTAEELARILENLVVNAREAMPGGGRVRITLQRGGGRSFAPAGTMDRMMDKTMDKMTDRIQMLETPPETLLLTVRDTGPGIPPEIEQRIFTAGFSTKGAGQGTRAGTGQTVGRGLGLAIVRELVERAGGRIRLGKPQCSRGDGMGQGTGDGACFEIEFPLLYAVREGSERRLAASPAGPAGFEGFEGVGRAHLSEAEAGYGALGAASFPRLRSGRAGAGKTGKDGAGDERTGNGRVGKERSGKGRQVQC